MEKLYFELTKKEDEEFDQELFIRWIMSNLKSLPELLAVVCEYELEEDMPILDGSFRLPDNFRVKKEAFGDDYQPTLEKAMSKLREAITRECDLDFFGDFGIIYIADCFRIVDTGYTGERVIESQIRDTNVFIGLIENYIEEESLPSNYQANKLRDDANDYLQYLYILSDYETPIKSDEDVDAGKIILQNSIRMS